MYLVRRKKSYDRITLSITLTFLKYLYLLTIYIIFVNLVAYPYYPRSLIM